MPPVVLYAGKASQRAAYSENIPRAAAEQGVEIELYMSPDEVDPARVDYLVFAANGTVKDFAPYTRLKAILNLWAGVEAVLAMDPPRDVPLARMVEDGLTLGMIDYVVGHVMRHHIDVDRFIGAEPIAEWEVTFPPLARDRRVGVLGLGALGAACAERLVANDFCVSGWSRTAKEIPGVTCRTGEDGLDQVIAEAEILVLLLPHTAETERVLDRRRISLMPEGACLVNAGRGPLIAHDALLDALDAGAIRHATMDVFDVEPLPADHRYWRHPRVTVTPHIASVTRPETASEALIRQIARGERGEAILHVVDRDRGY
jgi:glyoxylate/hydroxypyruvate reductase A